MNNDLISRSELKKVIETYRSNECFNDLQRGKNKMIDCCLAEINNAQTVEPFEPDYVGAERFEARQRGYEEGYHNGMKIGKTLNPKIKQGEWGKHGECPFCSYIRQWEDDKFCGNCGADMRKEGVK